MSITDNLTAMEKLIILDLDPQFPTNAGLDDYMRATFFSLAVEGYLEPDKERRRFSVTPKGRSERADLREYEAKCLDAVTTGEYAALTEYFGTVDVELTKVFLQEGLLVKNPARSVLGCIPTIPERIDRTKKWKEARRELVRSGLSTRSAVSNGALTDDTAKDLLLCHIWPDDFRPDISITQERYSLLAKLAYWTVAECFELYGNALAEKMEKQTPGQNLSQEQA